MGPCTMCIFLNSIDQNQMPQNMASDFDLHFKPLIQQLLNISTDSQMDQFQF